MTALLETLRRGERGYLAGLLDRSVRTLQLWARQCPAARPVGRPRHAPPVRRKALWLVAREWRHHGWTSGWRDICASLRSSVPVRLVQELLSLLKARRRRRTRDRREAARTTVRVPGADVLWSQDATHVGRDSQRHAVQCEVVRDVGSLRTLLISAGAPSSGEQVVTLLQALARQRGALPLVWSTDNGSAYCSEVVQQYLQRQRVVHLRNVPHTPQHNSWAERAIGELKAESGLGKGVRLADAEDALQRMLEARERLDTRRLRARLGYTTAEQADRSGRCCYSALDRERFYVDTCSAQREAAASAATPRARRLAERRATLDAIERLNSNSTHRGDASPEAAEREGIS